MNGHPLPRLEAGPEGLAVIKESGIVTNPIFSVSLFSTTNDVFEPIKANAPWFSKEGRPLGICRVFTMKKGKTMNLSCSGHTWVVRE